MNSLFASPAFDNRSPLEHLDVDPVDDLHLLFFTALRGLDRQARAWLAKRLPELIIDEPPGPVGVAEIEIQALGTFEFMDGGRRAFIQPVLVGGPYTDIVDLVAWRPDDPGQWWTQQYSGTPLGVDQLDRAEILGEPLAIRRTPLSLLQAGGRGIVVNDWAMTSPMLRCVPTLICEDDSHAAEIHRRLSSSPLFVPELRVFNRKARE